MYTLTLRPVLKVNTHTDAQKCKVHNDQLFVVGGGEAVTSGSDCSLSVCLSVGEACSGVCEESVCVSWFNAQQDRAFMLCVSYLD